MKKMLLSLLASTIYTSTVSAQSCQQPPSCESLGYTKSVDDCGDIEYLTCPFDSSKVYCPEVGRDNECEIGYIYYSDDTCSEEYDSSKEAIGVVYDPYNKLIMHKIAPNLSWATTSTCYLDMETHMDFTRAVNNFDGKLNSQTFIDYYNNYNSLTNFPALNYCYNLKDGNKEWFIPAVGQTLLWGLYQDKILEALQKIPNAFSFNLNGFTSTKYSCHKGQEVWYFQSPFFYGQNQPASYSYFTRCIANY
ncbi:MAG: hypothetical protein E7012_02735 [Alphaproteobacteria bacterium]|nr:hypothetical protein [Alphaproteobacteria bacterium]